MLVRDIRVLPGRGFFRPNPAPADAKPGVILALTGRNATALARVSRECEARGARVLSKVADVAARAELAAWISSVDAEAPLDLVVANAGVTATTLGLDAPEQFEAGTRGIFDTNVTGVFNTVFPGLEGMRRRGRGQVAIMSSVASMTSSNAGSLGTYAVRHRLTSNNALPCACT